jgi:hypothetical protein
LLKRGRVSGRSRVFEKLGNKIVSIEGITANKIEKNGDLLIEN